MKRVQSILGWPATRKQIHEVMCFVPDEAFERIPASGTPGEVRTRVEKYRQNGCTCSIRSPLSEDMELMIDLFAQA